MMLRAAVALIILAIAACALLSSYQHRPFPLQVDANSRPENAAVVSPNAMICRPLIIHGPQNPKPITRA